jgi:hypothetical protein
MKLLTLTAIPLLCAAFAPLCADAQGQDTAADKEAAAKQQKYMDDMNKITPSGEPAVSRYADPFITADFIWWKTQEDGLDYAFTGTSTTDIDADKGRIKHPRFRYEPGFKVGMGLKFRHDGWDVFAQYTRLDFTRKHHKGSATSSSDGASNVQSNIAMPYNGDLITFWADSAQGSWSLNFNVLDLELGRNFWVSKWLTMRPFVGMKFDWTTQKFNATYSGVSGNAVTNLDVNTGDLAAGSNVDMKMKQHEWAVGLRSGLNTTWYLWRHWCVFGELALSGMLDHFNSNRTDEITTPTGLSWEQNNFKNRTRPVTFVAEWSLGLGFESAFHHDNYMFQLRAAWENQIWFNQNQFPSFSSASGGNSNMSFEGLTIKAAFYF